MKPIAAGDAMPLHVAISWPAARASKVRASEADPALYEAADGLTHLPGHGVSYTVVDSSPRWLNPGHGRGSLLSGIDPWRTLRLLWNYKRYDALVSIDSSSALLFVLVKRLLRLSKPVLVVDPALDPSYRNRMRVHAAVLPHASRVVVFGEVQRSWLAEYMPSVAARFVPHRMDCRFFDPAKAGVPLRGGGYVLAVGSDVGRDYDLLVEAARRLQMPFVLHTRRPLPADLPDHVRAQREWISFEALRDLYAGARVVVVPLKDTIHASGVNGLLEALAMGCPTVVSASRGIADYVSDGANALVAPVGDAAGLAACIQRLWSDAEEAQRLSIAARARALAQCDMAHYSQSIASLLRESLPTPR